MVGVTHRPAEVVARVGIELHDVAVINIDVTALSPLLLDNSSKLAIGETVAAIGNPLGELTFSMSQGIVSCVDRAINVDGKPFNMIQVDCAIIPGNSGGPLFNSYGEVIGIVSAKYSSYSNTTVEGIGFAIPINDVIAMVEDIMTDGFVTDKPYIGITPQAMTAQMAQQYRYSVSEGVFVCSVDPDSAAAKAPAMAAPPPPPGAGALLASAVKNSLLVKSVNVLIFIPPHSLTNAPSLIHL